MDPVTHVALGAVVAHTAAHRTLGTRVLVVGAAAGASPDIDTLLSLSGDYFDELTLHRGITHSLFFAPVAGPLLGYAVWRLERRGGTQRLRAWIVALTLALLSHPLIDVTTSYGVQLLQPFSDARFAVWAMPIIDPVYTLVLLAGCLVAWRRPNWRAAPVVALALSTGYLAYAWHLGEAAADTARAELRAEGIENPEVAAFPMLLQVHYRRVVARTDAEVRTGFVSMWRPCPIAWSTAPRVRRARRWMPGAVRARDASSSGSPWAGCTTLRPHRGWCLRISATGSRPMPVRACSARLRSSIRREDSCG